MKNTSRFWVLIVVATWFPADPANATETEVLPTGALCQLERGVPLPLPDHPGNVFLEGEKVSVVIPEALNESPEKREKLARWRVLDDRLVEQCEGKVEDSGEIVKITIGPLPIGWYRVEFLDENGTLLDFTTAAVLAKLAAPVPQDSPICLDGALSWLSCKEEKGSDRRQFDLDQGTKLANLAALTGVNWIRDRITWREMQSEENVFSEPNQYDAMAKIQTRLGMKVLQTFHTIPAWARDESDPSRADLRHLYRFCKAMAERFRGTVFAWEPWNEGNAKNFGGYAIDEMCSLQKAAYLGFKAGNPDLTVCWNPFGGITTTHLADGILQNETWPYYDIYSIHSYDWPHAFEQLWEDARRAAAGRPIWVTEADRGMTADPESKPGDYSHDDAIRKAQLIAQEHARSLFSGSTRHFHFILVNYMEGERRVQFGLLRHDMTPRPSYVALAAAGRFLAGAKCLGRYEVANQPDTHIYAFRSAPDGQPQDVLVAWHEKEVDWPERGKQTVDWTLPTELQVNAVHDFLGRPLGKSVPVQLQSAPIYLILPAGEASKLSLRTVLPTEYRTTPTPSPVVLQLQMPDDPLAGRPSASNAWTQEQTRVFKPGQKTNCVMVVNNLGSDPVEGTLKLDMPEANWTFSKTEWQVLLEPMARTTIPFDVTRPIAESKSQPWITIRGDFGPAGTPILSFEAAAVGEETKPIDESLLKPLFESIDLNVGQTRTVTLDEGTTVTVKLIDIKEHRDGVRQAIRGADVTVEVNGERGTLGCATYHLPVELGRIRIDCPVVKGYVLNSSQGNAWAIDHDARLRIWPKQGPLVQPGTFGYPVKQCWGAAGTLFDNEIGDGEWSGADRIYYHQGFDFGGADRLTPVFAATDGLVVSARGKSLDNLPEPIVPRYDVVYLRDPRGWYYRYSHFDTIDETIQVGTRVTLGQKLGILGKEGASGGWSHLHFELVRSQENGQYGSDSMYGFLLQAYQAEHPNEKPVIAVARPLLLVEQGKPITLDASRSWGATDKNDLRYEWTFDDGTTVTDAKVTRVFEKPGRYHPILKVTDSQGNTDYDFAKVTVVDPSVPASERYDLHASYWPSQAIHPGDEVTFLVRSFAFTPKVGDEEWDFGDGSPTVKTGSDGCVDHHNKSGYAIVKHRFEQPGYYLVSVRRQNGNGQWAIDRLDVKVETPSP